MSTTDESVTDESTEVDESAEEQESTAETSTEETAEVVLDDGAKKVIAAERLAAKDARRAQRDAERKLAEFKASAALKDKPAEEQALEQARAEARTEATTKANERIVRAEVKAAAVGKIKNPTLALKLIDISGIDVDDDGEVDSDALQSAIADLLTEYPELAADTARFGGGADQGARGKQAKSSQLSKAEIEKLSPSELMKAYQDGRVDQLIGRTN